MSTDNSDEAADVEAIKQHVSGDVLEAASDEGVDADEIIAQTAQKRSGYKPQTVARFAKAAIESEVRSEKSETLNGIIMGSRDRYGKNWPRNHSLLRSTGDHLEVSTFGGEIPGPDGTDVRIPYGGAIVEMSAEYDAEHDSYEGVRLDSVDQLSVSETTEQVGKIAQRPSAVSRSDEYDVVAIQGEIAWADPQTVFEGGEPAGDGDVLMSDERGEMQPHFEVTLAPDQDTVVRGHAGRMAYGRPYFQVEDLSQLLVDAYEEFDSPDGQADFLQTALRGREVILVGSVSSIDTVRNEGETTTYVDVNLTGMVERGVGEEATESATGATESEPEPEGDDGDEGDDGPVAEIGSVREDIEAYCDLAGEDIDSLTVEDVQEKIKGVDADEVVIREALRGPDESADESADESDESGVEALRGDDGLLHCPADGCLYSAGSEGELAGHAGGAHDMSPDELVEMAGGS